MLSAERFDVAFSVGSLADARIALKQRSIDVLLLDLTLPDGYGLELCRMSETWSGDPRVIVLTSADDADALAGAQRAGCAGFLSKASDPGTIAAAVRAVANGERMFDLRSISREFGSSVELSPRERACLALVAEGLSNRSIAELLGVSPETVKTHLAVVRDKLGAADRAQAVAIAVRRGLL